MTYFVYDLGASEIPGLVPLIAEYDQNGNLVAKCHHDGGLITMTRGNQSYWHVFEAIGSVRQLTDAQSQVPDTYFYDAWGNDLTSLYSQVSNPFRYVGKHGYYLDTQSALMLLGVRYYTSAQGRFLNSDPLRDGLNWYAYVQNNPVDSVDPTGKLKLHGNYCGPGHGCRGTIPPCPPWVDEVDKCCYEHDQCYGREKCDCWYSFVKPGCARCDRDLCDCIKNANCKGNINCERARRSWWVKGICLSVGKLPP